MNDEMLRRLAEDIAKQTVIDSWPFYLLLIGLSFVGATIGPFLKARFTKRGEVAATKADAREILRQLGETTKTAKSVELSLARGDWIQREKNALKRAKLEQLMVSAFAISTWARLKGRAVLTDPQDEITPSTENFEMLSRLYFPELSSECSTVELSYQNAALFFSHVQTQQIQHKLAWDVAIQQNDVARLQELLEERKILQQDLIQPVSDASTTVYHAVQGLSKAAHVLMENLTEH
jgi:hypothetical protein